MKRLNNKGFMFTETIVVTTILMVSIMSIYVVFSNLYNNYRIRTKYENVEALYAANNIKMMLGYSFLFNIKDDFYAVPSESLDPERFVQDGYIDFSTCPSYDSGKFGEDTNFTTTYYDANYCSKIIAHSDIKTALFTNYEMVDYKNAAIDVSSFSNEFQDYVEYLKKNKEDVDDSDSIFRIIVELNNGNLSNILVESIDTSGGE